MPLLLFFLAHLLTLIAFVLIRYELIPQDPVLYKTAVTWAVYGFIPLLLSSYCCFYALARPGIAFLARQFSQWSVSNLHLANGCVYGIGMGLALLVMLQPGIGLKSLILFLIGLVNGLGTWQLYRRLVAVDPLAGHQQVEPVTDEVVEE